MKKIMSVVAASLTASLMPAAAATATTTVTIAQHGGRVVRGQHLLAYPARATLKGVVGGVSNGTQVSLEQVAFPFRGPFRTVARTTTGAGGRYSFSVHPIVATRYRVASATGVSTVATYYVTTGAKLISWPNCAGRSICHATWVSDAFVPSAAATTEVRKHVYFYDGINTGSRPPTRLRLNTHVSTSVTKLTNTRYRYTVSWTMRFAVMSTWQAAWCIRDSFSKDGIGLPESNGCGAASVPNQAGYLG